MRFWGRGEQWVLLNTGERTTIPESFTHAYVHSDLLRHIGPTAAITAMDTMPATLRTRV